MLIIYIISIISLLLLYGVIKFYRWYRKGISLDKLIETNQHRQKEVCIPDDDIITVSIDNKVFQEKYDVI